jgi:hypothetical protein
LGNIILNKSYTIKALPNFTRALYYHKQLNDRNPVMQTLIDIAKNIPGARNDDSAFAYGNESLSWLSKQVQDKLKRLHVKFFLLCTNIGIRETVHILYYKQYASIKDSV